MIKRFEKMIKHLKTQIAVSEGMGADFVYITKKEAEKCLELAEAEHTLLMEPVQAELEGGGYNWWYVCGECRSHLNAGDKYCHECGRKVSFN